MKEVLGIFAAIAAVAGIASVVSKEDEKEEAKQRQREQELELEERRLTVEAAQRKHIQQMEQQRLQMEQEKRDYQMKLANAPKKPIYKTVASLQCPLCMGHREVNEAAGEVHCPYCGATEQLEVDHYEIDQAAFQKQLQEAEQQRAAQEALEQRNERLNTAIKIVACVMGVALLILLISPIVGIAFFVPPFLLFCFLLYKRFPEKGGKVWNAIKFPLACIFVFPLPLTALFMGSEKMEERFSTVEVEETSQIVRINMDDLEKEREENAAAAKSKYKGQCIEVVGRVGNIDSDLDFISILSPTDSWDIVGVHCSLVNDDVKEKVKTLKVDQTVIVRGTITDVGEILGYYMDAEDIIIGAPLKTL